MQSHPPMRGLDARVWRTATLSAPFVVQGILGLLLITLWALEKGPFPTAEPYRGERTWMLTAVVITTLVSLVFSAALWRSPSPRRRGLSLSIAGCSVVVLIGGIIFAGLILR